MNRYQLAVIDYLVAENQPLKEQLDGRRLQLTDNQRRRFAVKAKAVGWQGYAQLLLSAGRMRIVNRVNAPYGVCRRERLGGMLSYYYRMAA